MRNLIPEQPERRKELWGAIRGHWRVESDHWVWDVTFNEDSIRTKSGNQAQVMATMRTLAMCLFRKAKIPNRRGAMDHFSDSIKDFGEFLAKVGFL